MSRLARVLAALQEGERLAAPDRDYLRRTLDLVLDLRTQQRAWFGARDAAALDRAKRLERDLDRHLAEGDPVPNLFDQAPTLFAGGGR